MYMNPWAELQAQKQDQMERFGKNWWILLITGIIAIIAGFIILGASWTLGSIAIFFGILLIIRGIFQLSSPGYVSEARVWNIFAGILSILVGVGIFFAPLYTLLFIAVFVGIWLVLTGIVDVIGSISVHRTLSFWWLYLVRGIIAIPLGIWALHRPVITLYALVYVIGIWAIVVGALEIAMSTEIHRLLPAKGGEMAPQHGTA